MSPKKSLKKLKRQLGNEFHDELSTEGKPTSLQQEANEPEGLFRLRRKLSKLLQRGPSTAIRNDCFECMGGSWKAVADCESAHCHQWLFRFGYDPRRKRILSEQERQERSERAKRNFRRN